MTRSLSRERAAAARVPIAVRVDNSSSAQLVLNVDGVDNESRLKKQGSNSSGQ